MSHYHGYDMGNPGPLSSGSHAVAGIWNPSGTRRITLYMLSAYLADFDGGAGWGMFLRRSTTRGTVGKTATPTANADREAASAPPSAFVLDMNYTVEPTNAGTDLYTTHFLPSTAGTNTGAGFRAEFPRGIEILPGTGIVLVVKTTAGASFPSDVLAISFEVGD